MHEHVGSQTEALHQLRMARTLAIWFHRTLGKAPKFKAGPFVPPPNPAEAEQALLDELERLRRQVTEHEAETLEALAAAQAADEKAAKAYSELETALDLAPDQAKAERPSLE